MNTFLQLHADLSVRDEQHVDVYDGTRHNLTRNQYCNVTECDAHTRQKEA